MAPSRTNAASHAAFTPTARQRHWLAFAVAVVAIMVGLLFAEAVVRIFSPHPVRTPTYDRVNGLLSYTPDTRARSYTPGSFDVIQTIGPQRFRGAQSYAANPPSGVIRIAAIGDSFTMGEGANDDESYPFELERLLRERRWPVEVINAGVGNTGTGMEALYYDEYVRNFHPDIVVLGVVANDPSDDVNSPMFRRQEDGTLAPIPEPERFHSRLWRFSRALHRFPPVAWLYGHSELLSLVDYELHAARNPAAVSLTARADLDAFYDEPHLQMTQDEIKWLAHRVAESGAQLVVVYLPAYVSTYQTRGHPYEEWEQDEAALAGACAQAAMTARVPFLDLRPYMRQVYAQDHQTLYHHGLDEHPNAAGYRAFARGIADFLERSGVMAKARHQSSSLERQQTARGYGGLVGLLKQRT